MWPYRRDANGETAAAVVRIGTVPDDADNRTHGDNHVRTPHSENRASEDGKADMVPGGPTTVQHDQSCDQDMRGGKA
jgi:hypothetical protein